MKRTTKTKRRPLPAILAAIAWALLLWPSAAELRAETLRYENQFEYYVSSPSTAYTVGDLIGQDDWGKGQWSGTLSDADVVAEGGNKFARLTTGDTSGSTNRYTNVWQNTGAVLDAGTVVFTADARYNNASTTGYCGFYLGDQDMDLVPSSPTGYSSTSTFGFRYGKFWARDGNGDETWTDDLSEESFVVGTWYTFQATVYLTDPDSAGPKEANTYDLLVLDRNTGNVVTSFSGLGFRTDDTDISRVGLYTRGDSEDWGSTGACSWNADNMSLTLVPEPASIALWLGGLLAFCLFRPLGKRNQ